MRINELIQVGTDRTEQLMPILDADGNETGEYETIVRETPIMQMVYRDMTAEEVAEEEALAASMPEPEPTPEERIEQLERKLAALTTY